MSITKRNIEALGVRKLAILTLWESGFTVKQISKLFNLSYNRVIQILRKPHIPGKGAYTRYEMVSRFRPSFNSIRSRERVLDYVGGVLGGVVSCKKIK